LPSKTTSTSVKRRGRRPSLPPVDYTKLSIRLAVDVVVALDRFCQEQGTPTSRARGIERLVRRALTDRLWAKEASHAPAH
jgi:metal-responsive CopG/Arc/MetJ family transcriptional regulator